MGEEDEIIAITGHRDYPDRGALYRGLDELRANQYYLGGARGTDTDALQYLSQTQPSSIRTVVVPNRLIDQPVEAQRMIKQYATEVIELGNTGPDRFMIRNRYMVDHSQRTVAFYDYRGSGGTFNTIQYSRSIGRPCDVKAMLEFNYQTIQGMSRDEFQVFVQEMRNRKVPLQAGKAIIMKMLKEVYHMSTAELAEALGYPGVFTLEDLWAR